jgi:hypothetical protein
MEIRQFDKMAQDDRAEYVARWLIEGAEKVLADAGRPKDAEKVSHLFMTNVAGANISIGMAEFMRNLARARVADIQNITKDPNSQRLEVEDAMFVTLQKNGIELPDSFFTVASGFKPKFPPQVKDKKN